MSMGMSMSMGMVQSQTLVQSMTPSLIQWSLFHAYQKCGWGPPPYVEPTFEEEVFEPRFRLERRRIADFESLDHVTRMKLVDEANKVFRFDYRRGLDYDDQEKYFFKVPLLRDRNVMEHIEDITVRISCAEYERATAMLKAVGEMERIARAVPYHGLYRAVTKHLRRFKVDLNQTVLVSVDRGGRLPCIVLMRALGLATMYSLKVDQSGGRLDEDRLQEFADQHTLQGKHILFVDSTVDSGRQIQVLQQFFDHATWRSRLGHGTWSVVGSNEYARNLERHQNINWGVDPDATFEDNPDLMGIDYASGDRTKVVDRPSAASEAIRQCLLSVPDGYIYSADDIGEQISHQREQWKKRHKKRRAVHREQVKQGRAKHVQEVETHREKQAEQEAHDKLERQLNRITASKRWQQLKAAHRGLPTETLPTAVQNGSVYALHNVLVVGSGSLDLPSASTRFVADNLGPHCSFFAGTPDGNPGAVLHAVLGSPKVQQPEVRLYQPERMRQRREATFGKVPVQLVGREKDDMRRQMISDSHFVLTLGGAEGTLREVLLSLQLGKPTVVIEGYGPVAAYVLTSQRLRKNSNLKPCKGLAEAVQTILEMSKV